MNTKYSNPSSTKTQRWRGKAQLLANIRGFLLFLLSLILALYVSWMINAQLGYGYSWLYHAYSIDQHIEEFAPQNRFRQHFGLTTEQQHKDIFQQIVVSVHNDGVGLEAITYDVNEPLQARATVVPVLHAAEIIHLQDVAHLINRIHWLAGILTCVWLALVLLSFFSAERASNKGMAAVFLIALTLIISLFVGVGAKEIFYQLHIWIFPAENQWFFYYQDSLMSTLMKAPVLFAGIALQVVLLGMILFAGVLYAWLWLFKANKSHH